MSLCWRPMNLKDVDECVEIVASHPVIGPRYTSQISNLRSAWANLLGRDSMTTAVFEEVAEHRTSILGVGVGVFVRDEFIRELKTHPLFWFGPELAKRVVERNSPVLSDSEVREANSGEGLNELVWESLLLRKYEGRAEIYHLMVTAYLDLHRGFLLKEMITSQAESAQRAQWAVDAGGLYWDVVQQRYLKSISMQMEEFIQQPHLVGLTRQLEFSRPGSWVGTLFDYQPPCFGFSRSEQELLQTALRSQRGTDQELADKLYISALTIKKMWLSIYRRVANRRPDVITDPANTESGGAERGREKRRRLLAYLRDHPEELRPVSQKILVQTPPRIGNTVRRQSSRKS